MGLVDLIAVSHWDMKRLHDGPVDRVEQSRHFGLGSSFNSIDSDQWHGVILPFLYSLSDSVFGPLAIVTPRRPGQNPAREVPSFHWLEFLDSPAPICLSDINIAFGINRQSVAMSKRTDLMTRTPEA
jgi:hypothetical protein